MHYTLVNVFRIYLEILFFFFFLQMVDFFFHSASLSHTVSVLGQYKHILMQLYMKNIHVCNGVGSQVRSSFFVFLFYSF